MRWIKHLSDAHSDEKMAILRAEAGFEGYGFYWFALEVLAKHIDDKTGKTSLTYPVKFWASLAGVSTRNLRNLVGTCAKLNLLTADFSENLLTLDCPNLLKYRDEWTRKKSKNSGATPEKLRRKDIDTDSDTDIKSPPIPPAENTAEVPAELPKPLAEIQKESAAPSNAIYRARSNPISPAERQNRATAWPPSGFRNMAVFEEFWGIYPRQIGKAAAFKAWQDIDSDVQNITPQQIIDALKAQIANGHHFDGLDGTPAIPFPARWLSDGRWDDQVGDSPGASSPTAGMTLAQKLEWARTQG